MKKYLLTIILFILIIPTVVFAASTCNPSDIEIKTVTLSKSIGNGQEVTAASIDDKSINLDVKLYDPNDYMEYTITVKNNGTEDYYIKEQDFNNDQYLKYEFVHENSTFKIEPNEEKEITLRVSYKNRVEGNANYTTTDSLSLNILDKQDIAVANTLKNIGIASIILIVITIISIFIGGGIVLNNKIKCLLVMFTGVALIIPLYVDASCDAKIDVDVKVELDNKNAMFDTGPNFAIKIKTLAGTTIDEENQEWTIDTNVTAFKKSSTEPTASNKETKNIVSDPNSPLPIYVWFDNGTIWWWSEDETPSLNEDSTALFSYMYELTDISGISSFDTSNAKIMYGSLCCLEKLESIDAVANWNTSKFEDISYLFCCNYLITNLDALRNWDTSNVKSLEYTFWELYSITNIDALANWDTSKVTDVTGAFESCESLTNVNGLRNWNVSKVTDLTEIFYGCYELDNISGLENWNTSAVVSINRLFGYCIKLKNVDSLANWNTSNVTDMTHFLYDCETLESITGIANWNTSKVETMDGAFAACYILNDISSLANWNTSNVTNMKELFHWCYEITNLDALSRWNTAKVTNLEWSFCFMTNLSDISGLANWNTSKVTNMVAILAVCSSLENAEAISKWDTSSVTNMSAVFEDCENLTSVDVSKWDTSKVTDMSWMFYETAITVLDISSFDTRNVTNIEYFFWGSDDLTTVYIGENWDVSGNTGDSSYFFPDTCNLPNFSTSNTNFNNISWAKPTTEGGYLTLKTND